MAPGALCGEANGVEWRLETERQIAQVRVIPHRLHMRRACGLGSNSPVLGSRETCETCRGGARPREFAPRAGCTRRVQGTVVGGTKGENSAASRRPRRLSKGGCAASSMRIVPSPAPSPGSIMTLVRPCVCGNRQVPGT